MLSSNVKRPRVSIVLPTFNRARFLPEVFAALRAQTETDWELIVIDDGSTDDTRQLIRDGAQGFTQHVDYVWQENQGAAAARNAGLERASGKYVAFYDSDDLWLPHHLSDCVHALEANTDVDWVYGACQVVDTSNDEVRAPSTFYVNGEPRPFLKLNARRSGALRVFDDPGTMRCLLDYGLFCGLQCSVIRREVFASLRIPNFRVGEDRLLPVLALKDGASFGYLDNVHVVYRIHEANTCDLSGVDTERQLRNFQELINASEYLLQRGRLDRVERRSVRRALGTLCFWQIGYATLWQAGRRRAAIDMFQRGLRYWPWDWRRWKTYAVSVARFRMSAHP